MKQDVNKNDVTTNKKVKVAKKLFQFAGIVVLGISFQNCSKSGFSPLSQSSGGGVVSQSGPGSVKLSWDDNTESALAGYKIYYGTSSKNYTNSVDVGRLQPSAGAVSFQVSGLTSKSTYYFAVTAYDSSHTESPTSNEVSAQVQ
ncbi:MAG: fibronectin type III domain-containing protein [Bdellovibrio sp.]